LPAVRRIRRGGAVERVAVEQADEIVGLQDVDQALVIRTVVAGYACVDLGAFWVKAGLKNISTFVIGQCDHTLGIELIGGAVQVHDQSVPLGRHGPHRRQAGKYLLCAEIHRFGNFPFGQCHRWPQFGRDIFTAVGNG